MTTEEMPNTVVNLEQAQAWDGEEGARWTEHEDRYNASVRRHTPQLLVAAHISATDQVPISAAGVGSRREGQHGQPPAGGAWSGPVGKDD
jgi:hypothetical protein